MMAHVRSGLASGDLQERQMTEYYLEALSHAFPRPPHAGERGFGTLEDFEIRTDEAGGDGDMSPAALADGS